MDYNRHDELIIMLVLAIMKKVTSGQSGTDLCLVKTLIIKLERGHARGRMWPQWSRQCNSMCNAHWILIYSFIRNRLIGFNLYKQTKGI